MNKFKILILGASGMLGHTLYKYFSMSGKYDVIATIRSSKENFLLNNLDATLIGGIDVESTKKLANLINYYNPDLVINCVGLIKQYDISKLPIPSIKINSLFPHKLNMICRKLGARLIHFSTDCVFLGTKGKYKEEDPSDAIDIYGKSKYLGEINDNNVITFRTSIIGPQLYEKNGLFEWFMSQKDRAPGYTRAIFSGLPTIEIAEVIDEFVIPNSSLEGIYHLSGDKISKRDLLKLISKVYEKKIKITVDHSVVIDRSLDSSKFYKDSGYTPKSWDVLINKMKYFG